MWDGFQAWVNANASLAVSLALLMIGLVWVTLGLTWAVWVRPRLAAIESNQIAISRLEGATAQLLAAKLPDSVSGLTVGLASLQVKVDAITSAKLGDGLASMSTRVTLLEESQRAERERLVKELAVTREALNHSLEDLRNLQRRSSREIGHMVEQKHLNLAEEQALQDVKLAQIAEQLARLAPSQHAEALQRLRLAIARHKQLRTRERGEPDAARDETEDLP